MIHGVPEAFGYLQRWGFHKCGRHKPFSTITSFWDRGRYEWEAAVTWSKLSPHCDEAGTRAADKDLQRQMTAMVISTSLLKIMVLSKETALLGVRVLELGGTMTSMAVRPCHGFQVNLHRNHMHNLSQNWSWNQAFDCTVIIVVTAQHVLGLIPKYPTSYSSLTQRG